MKCFWARESLTKVKVKWWWWWLMKRRTGYDIMIKFFCGMQNGGSGVAERPDSWRLDLKNGGGARFRSVWCRKIR
jgi:hypothetical protein